MSQAGSTATCLMIFSRLAHFSTSRTEVRSSETLFDFQRLTRVSIPEDKTIRSRTESTSTTNNNEGLKTAKRMFIIVAFGL
jgi:hypothetical protein